MTEQPNGGALEVAESRGFGTDRDDLVAYSAEGGKAGGAAICSIYAPPLAPLCAKAGEAIGEWIAENVLAEGSTMSDLVKQSWEGGGAAYGRRRYVNEMVDTRVQWAGYEALYDSAVEKYGRQAVEELVGPKVPDEFLTTPEEAARLTKEIEGIELWQSPELLAVDAAGLSRRIYAKLPFDVPKVGEVNPYKLFQFDGTLWEGDWRPPLGSHARQVAKMNSGELIEMHKAGKDGFVYAGGGFSFAAKKTPSAKVGTAVKAAAGIGIIALLAKVFLR